MTHQQLAKIRTDLIQLQSSVAIGSDIYIKCNDALEITEDLMVNMEFANQEEKQLVFKDLVNGVSLLTSEVFGPLGDQ